MVKIQDIETEAKTAGFFPLRPPQVKAFETLARGENLLVIWPTGSGKSLCYQLPAVTGDGLTLVISPLIALMEDQTARGKKQGWPVTCIHSALSAGERAARLSKVEKGEIKLLYVTPERFRQEAFRELLSRVKISLFAVDEAHCISQWGHDFRPDYSRLGEIRKFLGSPQTLALTATATVEVQKDILRQLELPESTPISWEGLERPNLFLAAEEVDEPDDKLPRAERWLAEVEGPKIVYFTLISTLEKNAAALAKKHKFTVYHGDLEDRLRHEQLRQFMAGESSLMLATPAFGLGVDKPDIRGILHFETPGSLEAYFQEVGRAGRDGKPSNCLLLYTQSDLETHMRFIETLTPEPSFVRAVFDRLKAWQDRLNTLTLDDLREQLSFKNKKDFRLETALSFLDRWNVIEFPHRQLKRLRILRDLTDTDLTPELWQARRLQLQKKLLSLVQWFRSEECRKVGIYRYFGWHNETPCGFCDRCEET